MRLPTLSGAGLILTGQLMLIRRSHDGLPHYYSQRRRCLLESSPEDFASLSTSEAEYVAASHCGQEVYYMREILRDFGFAQTAPAQIYEDILACVVLPSEDPVRRKFFLHIDILCFPHFTPYCRRRDDPSHSFLFLSLCFLP